MSRTRAMLLAALSAGLVCADVAGLAQDSDGHTEAEVAQPAPEQVEFFEKRVRPLLAENCWKCHGPEQHEANLRLDSRAAVLRGGDTGPAVVPGQPEQSEMVLAIRYDPDGYQMPPTGKLPQEAIDTLTEWVRMGAPWPVTTGAAGATSTSEFDIARRSQHWSFQPVEPQTVPAPSRGDWAASPIDAFILSRLEAVGLPPAGPADRRVWLRRVTFDLSGLPPAPEETADFLADDAPDAEHKVVDRLLASPHYGERWGRHWLDLMRFAETSGHEFDPDIPYAWRYRDYAVRALNADLPYDQFVIEHVAGDLLETPRRHLTEGWNESILATGFWWFSQGKHSPVDVRAEECDRFDNQIDVLGKAFLGVTIACARCHDHKFDAISTADYYALAGYLQSTRRQIAFIDDERVATARTRLEELKQANRDTVAEAVYAAVMQNDEHGLREEAERFADPAHPLHAWSVLSKHRDPAAFADARTALLAELRRQSAAAALSDGVQVFEDFDAPGAAFQQQDASKTAIPHSDGNTHDQRPSWYASGPAFGDGPTSGGEFVLAAPADSIPVRELAPAGLAHSGRLSPRFRGTLRSETFTITKPYIDYRVRRVRGRSSPEAKHKNGQVHLIIDGFHLIQNPLYGGLSINTANDGEFHWYRQDVSKLIGSRGFIEIEDEEPDGWIVVDRILFTDGSRPSDPPNTLVLDLLANRSIASRDAFEHALSEQIAEAAAPWRSGELDSSPHANDRVALLNAAMEGLPTLAAGDLPQPLRDRLSAFLTEYRAAEQAFVPSRRAIAAADGSAENEHVLVRGNHKKPGPEVARRFLEVFHQPQLAALVSLPEAPPERGSGRLDLARAIAHPRNPLTSRVLVNRLWHHHFGRGLAPTVDNLGVLGEPPSHPELLDWLAADFVAGSFSMKRLHQAIVHSATYRQSSVPAEPRAAVEDPENRLWHCMPVRRLEAESIRDAILAVSGRLDRRLEGESVPPYLTPFMEGRGRPGASGPLDGDGRRSLYINVRRNFLTPLFLAFDYPNPLSTMGRRSVSNVPAQALALMNNPFVIQQAELWAARTLEDASPEASAESIVHRLYETAFTRPPTRDELAAALGFVGDSAADPLRDRSLRRWADLCHVLLNVKEFVFVP